MELKPCPLNEAPWRPRFEPARSIHDAIWSSEDSVNAAWYAARDAAQKYGVPVLTLEDVREAELTALFHTDYSAKFAHSLVRRLGLENVCDD